MPELPEVETVVRGLIPDLVGARAGKGWTDWPRVLDGMPLSEFNPRIEGQEIEALHRRGKYICIRLSKDYLVVHLRMTGRLYLSHQPTGNDRWVHFSLGLADGRFLAFSDSRKFGRVQLVGSLDYLETKLGPEPLEMKPAAYLKLLRGSQRAVKVFLLDQKRIAGIGNIYADEALFRAGIAPNRSVNTLTDPERRRLGKAIVAILQKAIDYEGASIQWYRKPDGSQGESQKHFQVYGRADEPCLRCGTQVSRITLGQRSTHFCRKCQT